MTAQATEGLRIEALGPIRAWHGDAEVSLGPTRQRALFAILALRANHVVSRSEMIDAIWGNAAPASAEGSIHTYVSGLRRALEPDHAQGQPWQRIVSVGRGYLLRLGDEELDAAMFESGARRARQLRAADGQGPALQRIEECLRLWRGNPLAGLPGPFAETERVRLTELQLSLIEDRAELMLALGRHREVATDLAEAVRTEPLRERLRSLLMLALYRCGRQADALAEFTTVRHLLNEELGLDPGADLRELHEQILRSDPQLIQAPDSRAEQTEQTTTSTAASYGRRPAQLPHDVAGFVGRSNELDQLAAWATNADEESGSTAVLISAIDGAGGIGKTALAIRFGHQVAEHYPDGQLYVNLRGFDPSQPPLTTEEALAQLLRGLGVDRIPVEVDAQAGLYRSLLAGQRMLVLLDNGVAADQVRDLLPGHADCLVLVTSRNRLGGLVVRDGAHRLTLGLLTPDDSLALLTRIIGPDRIGSEPDAAEGLARLCGYLPLALRIAAERVSSLWGLSVAELVRELAAERDRLDMLGVEDDETTSVRAVFSWSYESLKPDLARAFRRLGLHPGADIGIPAAAALIGVPTKQAGVLLDGLDGRHLIERVDRGRYQFHDLLHLYATELAEAEDSAEQISSATRRVVNWYLHTAYAACVVATPGARAIEMDPIVAGNPPLAFDNAEQAFAWYESESANLIAATRMAASRNHNDIAWKLAFAQFSYFYSSGLTSDWISVLHTAVAAADEAGDKAGQASVLNHLSVALSRIGDNEEAVECLQRAMALLADNRSLQPGVLANLGSTLREMGRHQEGIDYALQALALARELGLGYYEAGSLDTLCELYVELNQTAEALEYGSQGLVAARAIGSKLVEANLLVNLGHANSVEGRFAQAYEHYEQALEVCRAVNDRYHEAHTLLGIAALHQRQHQIEPAREHAERALQIFSELDAEEAGTVRIFLATLN